MANGFIDREWFLQRKFENFLPATKVNNPVLARLVFDRKNERLLVGQPVEMGGHETILKVVFDKPQNIQILEPIFDEQRAKPFEGFDYGLLYREVTSKEMPYKHFVLPIGARQLAIITAKGDPIVENLGIGYGV